MTENISKIYEDHHKKNREEGFSILKEERGSYIRQVIGRGKKVLDIGCRDGALTEHFLESNDVLGVDIDATSLDKAKKKGIRTMRVDLNGDWHEIGEEKFDAVVAGEVLEHLYNPGKIADQVSERLVEGGIFVGSVPNAFSLINRVRYLFGQKRGTPLSDPTHINQFHIDELGGILRKRFTQVEIAGLGRHALLARIFPGLFGFDLFFICIK